MKKDILLLTCLMMAGLGSSPAIAGPISAPDAKAPEKALGFDEALRKMIHRDTTVAAQQASLDAVRARGLPARLFFLPTMTASIYKTSSFLASQPQPSELRMEGNAKLNLFRFGGDLAGFHAAHADEAREEASLAAAQLTAEMTAVQALVGELQTLGQAEVYRSKELIRRQSLDIARQRFDRGYLPLQEVNKVQVDLENTRAQLADTEIREERAAAELERLLGSRSVQNLWPWKERKWPTDSAGIAQLFPAELPLGERPDFRAAKLSVEAEDHRLTQNWRNLLPTLDSSFQLGTSDPYGNYWTGTLALNLPLFDRLSTLSQVRAQFYSLTAAEIERERVRRLAVSEWNFARKDFETSLRSAESREKVLLISRQLYQDNLKRFQSGRISANDLTLDLNRLSDSEFLAVEGWAEFHLALTRACHAQGKLLIKDCPLVN